MRRVWSCGLVFFLTGCAIHTSDPALLRVPPELHVIWNTPTVTCDLRPADDHLAKPHAHLQLHAWVTGVADPTDRLVVALPLEGKAARFPAPVTDIVTVNIAAPSPSTAEVVVEWQSADRAVHQRFETVVYVVPCGEDE